MPADSVNWSSWASLTPEQQRSLLQENEFWSRLDPEQRRSFLAEADWQQILRSEEAKQAKLAELVSLEAICERLGISQVQVFWLMSTRKLPGALVGGTWKFDPGAVDRWVAGIGGREAARRDVEEQMARHRAASEGGAKRPA